MINKVLLMEFFKDDDIKVVDKDFYIKSQMKSDVIKYITILEDENERLNNIIDKLEYWLKLEIQYNADINEEYNEGIENILNRLEELKEGK